MCRDCNAFLLCWRTEVFAPMMRFPALKQAPLSVRLKSRTGTETGRDYFSKSLFCFHPISMKPSALERGCGFRSSPPPTPPATLTHSADGICHNRARRKVSLVGQSLVVTQRGNRYAWGNAKRDVKTKRDTGSSKSAKFKRRIKRLLKNIQSRIIQIEYVAV